MANIIDKELIDALKAVEYLYDIGATGKGRAECMEFVGVIQAKLISFKALQMSVVGESKGVRQRISKREVSYIDAMKAELERNH